MTESAKNRGALSRAGLAWYSISDYAEPGEGELNKTINYSLLVTTTNAFELSSSVLISAHYTKFFLISHGDRKTR